jgi:DUF971 family protein
MSTLSPLASVVAAPAHIAVSGQLDALLLTMDGGTVIELPATRLRASCKCAHCLRARIDGVFPDRFTGIAITDVAPIGGYAVNIAFSDGHNRGIYPWALLMALDRADA